LPEVVPIMGCRGGSGRRYRVGVANGKAVGRFEAALGIIGLAALAGTYFLVSGKNPLPAVGKAMQTWLDKASTLSTPEPAWRQRLGDTPSAATVVGHTVVFTVPSGAEARDAGTGQVLWTRPARWVAVASDTVLLGRGRDSGYDAVDPGTGGVRWHGAGLAVWTFRDGLLSMECPADRDCTLSRRSTEDGGAAWTTNLPDSAKTLAGAHASTDPVPPALGFPVEDRVHVVNTGTGARLREEPTSGVRVTVLGGRTLRSTASRRDEDCRLSIEARDPASGRTIWKKTGYALGTAPASTCAQGRAPIGAGTTVVTVRADNRPALLSTADGHEIWVGTAGQTVLALDARGAVVRSADHQSITLIDLSSGSPAWTRRITGKVTLGTAAVVVTDTDAGRLVGYDRGGGGTVVDVQTQATVLGVGPAGVVLGQDRTVGVLPFNRP
jgi:outer membrane protein assembly factor BamB